MRKFLYLGILSLALTGCSSDDSVNDFTEIISLGEDQKDTIEWTYSTRVDFSADEHPTVEGINKFSYELMKEVALSSENGEFSISPVSIAIYLGMLANATAGDTKSQILEALGADDVATLNSICEKYMHYLPCDDNGSSISINNRFWVNKTYTVPSDFSDLMAFSYNAGVETVDFSKEITVLAINQWVADNTNGLITSLLDGDWKNYLSIPMANANTVYFKGLWHKKFDSQNTKSEIFHTPNGSKDVKMMHNTIRCVYSSNDLAEMVNLEFEGQTNNMELYLPTECISPQQLIADLTIDLQTDLRNKANLYDITISLPLFTTFCSYDLSGSLSNLGITNLKNVDFTPMGLGIQQTSVIHKTSVKIDEEGAEMAAITGGWVTTGAPDEKEYKKVKIDFNRPFVYIVRNRHTGAILMAGAVTNP